MIISMYPARSSWAGKRSLREPTRSLASTHAARTSKEETLWVSDIFQSRLEESPAVIKTAMVHNSLNV